MSSPPFKQKQTGLTVMEMMVVIVIVTIISTVVIANLPLFRHRLAFDLLAEEVALTIRSAQVYGITTRGVPGTEAFPSHGIVICPPGFREEDCGEFIKAFHVFADTTVGGDRYPGEYTDSSEIRETFELTGGVVIDGMYSHVCGESELCNRPFQIVFQRPNPDARFLDYPGGGSTLDAASCVYLRLYSPRLAELGGSAPYRFVVVWRTGHIYAAKEAPSCT